MPELRAWVLGVFAVACAGNRASPRPPVATVEIVLAAGATSGTITFELGPSGRDTTVRLVADTPSVCLRWEKHAPALLIYRTHQRHPDSPILLDAYGDGTAWTVTIGNGTDRYALAEQQC